VFRTLGGAPQTDGVPYRAWDLHSIRVTERALLEAWRSLVASRGAGFISSSSEPLISAALREELEDLLNSETVPGFTPAIFSPVIIGQELRDHAGNIEKRPDFTFRLLSSRPARTLNALFFEAKVLGNGRTLKQYVEEGLQRFIDGRYAWCMRHAGMVAYVADSTYSAKPDAELRAHWGRSGSRHMPIGPVRSDGARPLVALTAHPRAYSLSNGVSPGEIEIRHLWLGLPPEL
jgi:hypothetical protein